MPFLAEHHRTFGYAAAASLAFHALLLSVRMPQWPQPELAPPEPPLVARLAEPAPPPVAEPPALPPAAPAPPPTPPPKKRAAAPKAAPKPVPKPVPEASEAQQELSEEEPTPAPAPAPAAPPAPPVVAIAPPAPAPAPLAPVDPAAELARYRHALVTAAARYKRYPRAAVDNGWAGNVVVQIQVAASGAVASVTVKTSSGYEVLDAQALEMFRKAAPEVPAPAALRGRHFSVEVRAIYNFKEGPG
ncbi:MAG TPA: energy transducer TonB [Burkholderiales bacterium]